MPAVLLSDRKEVAQLKILIFITMSLVHFPATGIAITNTGIANAPNGNGPRKNIYIFNNTIYRARWNGGAGIYLVSDNIENIVIQNNLVYYNLWNGEITAAISSILPKITVDHNIVFGRKECSLAFPDCAEITDISDPINYPKIHDNITVDPKFVNGNAYDFHLLSDSPAADSGLPIPNLLVDYDNIFRPQGLAYDIGAFEYVSPPIAGEMNGDRMANDIYLSDRSNYSEINGSSAYYPIEIAGSNLSLVSPLFGFFSTSWPLYLMFDVGAVN